MRNKIFSTVCAAAGSRMESRMKKKGIRYGLAVCLIMAAVLVPQICVWASQTPVVTLNRGSKGSEADVSVTLPEDVSALQIRFRLETPQKGDIREAEFVFDSRIKDNTLISIKDFVYDEETGTVTVFVAGNDVSLGEVEKTQNLGTLTVKSSQEVRVTVTRTEMAQDGEKQVVDLEDAENSNCILSPSEDESLEPGDHPGSDPGDNPGGDPGDNPGNDPGDNPGGDPGDNPGNDPGDNPGNDPGDNPEDESGNNPGNNPSNRPGGSHSGGGSKGGGSSSRSVSGTAYTEPVQTATEIAGSWEWTGTVWKFRLSSGLYAKNTWVYVKEQWYHMNQNAEMDLGWYQDAAGTWYYLTETGAMKKGWLDLNGVRYHLQEDNGKMSIGWYLCDNCWFFSQLSGEMLTGWQLIYDKWYYLNPVMPVPVQVQNPETGQIEESVAGQRLYGAMYADETTPDGYQVDQNGARK